MYNPFKPGSGLYPPYFAGRDREIGVFKNKLEQVKSGSPMHLSIIGEWASGKTSLLLRFKEIAEKNGFLCSFSIASQSNTAVFIATLISNILSELKKKHGQPFYKKLLGVLKGIKSAEVFGFGVTAQDFERIVTPQLDLKLTLNDIWNMIAAKYRGLVILIDDLDTVLSKKETLLTLRNAVMESIIEGCKVMCVVSGSEKLFGEFEKAHAPLIRFFEPYILANLGREEAKEAILNPLHSVKVVFPSGVVARIVEVTGGQPYYIQEFCYHLFNNAVNNKVTEEVFEASYTNIMHDIAGKIWNQKIQQLGDINTKILHLVSIGENKVAGIIRKAKSKFDIPIGTIKSALSRMQREGKIDKTTRGVYVIRDGLFKEYLRGLF